MAAAIWDGSEGLRDREAAGLETFLTASRILVGAVSHQVRNIAAAAAAAYASVKVPTDVAESTEFQSLGLLVRGSKST